MRLRAAALLLAVGLIGQDPGASVRAGIEIEDRLISIADRIRAADGPWNRLPHAPAGGSASATMTCMSTGGDGFRSDTCIRPVQDQVDLGWSTMARQLGRTPTGDHSTGDDGGDEDGGGGNGGGGPTPGDQGRGGDPSTRATPARQSGAGPSPSRTAAPMPKPYVFDTADLAGLELTSPPLYVQPPGRYALINVPVIAYTTPTTVGHSALLRGHQVEFRVTPAEYRWRFGDTDITTAEPGAPYPDHTVHHTYNKPGLTSISLTVRWRVEFRTGSGVWRPTGQVLTTDAGQQERELVTATPHLIP